MNIPNFADLGLALAPNMRVSAGPAGCFELQIEEAGERSAMQAAMLAPTLFAATVDFHVGRCPNVLGDQTNSQLGGGGLWFTLNYCIEGRCEVEVPGGGSVVVEPGDVCASYTEDLPREFRYPLERYCGVEVFVNSAVAREPSLAPLAEARLDFDAWARQVGAAAIFSNDAELIGLMERMGELLGAFDAPSGMPRAKVAFMELAFALVSRDLEAARPKSFLTKGQMGIAASARSELERDLAAAHDVRAMAAARGVGVTSLNAYFSRVYGASIPAYLRRRRMEEAARLLAGGSSVADAALAVGYANPSKFAAAFARAHGCPPSEWRRRSRSA